MEKGLTSLEQYCRENNKEYLLKEWDYEKNGDLKLDQVSFSSNKRVWWKCKRGHEWDAQISNRTRTNGTNCPICNKKQILKGYNDLETLCPEMAKEWHPTLNGDLKPSQVSCGSNKKVWWQCSKGHEWETSIMNRTNKKSNCPCCSGRNAIEGINDLETKFPNIAKEWHSTKNGGLKPSQVLYGSAKKVWWKCSCCGYEYERQILSQIKVKIKCTYCKDDKYYLNKNIKQ